ncbi:amidohydrolase [uncultured Nocardioides sp.]|uniref:amidohydrolase n=1 Tax=uncultured Nocardioides sp. TaxID=198441 RepID=UPI0025F70692|nr:amidohydrolase family protein [uncultured Nocardioides sp.]
MRTLLRGATLAGSPATSVAVDGDRIVWVGTDDEAWDGADEVLDVHGALVAPAFVDAHVHAVRTGFALTQLDLTGATSGEHLLDLLSSYAAGHPHDLLVGNGWDESGWPVAVPPTADEIERAVPGREVYLTRVDGHSAVVSHAFAATVPALSVAAGWTPDGRVERAAHHVVRDALAGRTSDEQRLAAARAACGELARHGFAGFHENAAPHIGPESEVALVRRAAQERGLAATVYWGQLGAVDKARELGVRGLAGDLVADGALGSRTAALATPYADASPHCGHAYLTAEQVAEHVVACSRAGLQAGFHCIGDAALDAVADGFEAAARTLGVASLAGHRHRLEHVEMPSRRVVEVLGRLGVLASVQPMFDALWGGPSGMYADRLGERWRGMNPLRDLAAATRLAFGSDSPVTPVGGWAAVRAAVLHHDEQQRLDVAAAHAAHTAGGWFAAGDDDSGALEVGRRADLAVWDVPGGLAADGWPELHPDLPLPTARRTLAAGTTIWKAHE